MKKVFLIFGFVGWISCKKSVENDLPAYDAEIAVEMYLEDGNTLQCLVTETLPYSSSWINKMLDSALVTFSDGKMIDTLLPAQIYDYESGRRYNFASGKLFFADSAKTYFLKITDTLARQITSTTKTVDRTVRIDSVICLASSDSVDKYSVGLSFDDPEGSNYYRILIGEGVNNYESGNTDLLLSDLSFDGQQYSLTSPSDYKQYDTITIRLYTLLKEHYDYLKSAESARTANFNPFMQPVRVKTNIQGGQGIFTAIAYDERRLVIR